jgi:serine/threonine-protein kinase
MPTPKRPGWRRPRFVIPALAAVVLLIGGGIFAAVKVSQHHKPTATPTVAAPPPNTGPFTGTYRADYGAPTDLDGKPFEGTPPTTITWAIRSACRPTGCVATASRLGGGAALLSTMVFDDVGGRWVAVGVGPDTCDNAPVEQWVVIMLQPRPDGALAGEYNRTNTSGCEVNKRTVTFTRTGDVDVTSLPDPASQPPRVVSPAEALHGRYHETIKFANGEAQGYDYAVRTDCLRTGDRCMSYFHNPDSRNSLVFGSGKWTNNEEYDAPSCGAGGAGHVKRSGDYPLPQPLQDPITLLTGRGHNEVTAASSCAGRDFDDKFVRTGD